MDFTVTLQEDATRAGPRRLYQHQIRIFQLQAPMDTHPAHMDLHLAHTGLRQAPMDTHPVHHSMRHNPILMCRLPCLPQCLPGLPRCLPSLQCSPVQRSRSLLVFMILVEHAAFLAAPHPGVRHHAKMGNVCASLDIALLVEPV